jgi:hypothetical protein
MKYVYFHLLPLDKWDLCKTGTLNVHSWAIKVIVNRRFWINYIMMKKKKKSQTKQNQSIFEKSWLMNICIHILPPSTFRFYICLGIFTVMSGFSVVSLHTQGCRDSFKRYFLFKTTLNALIRVWRYQRGNQNPYIEEQTTHLPKEKVQ